MKSLFTCKIMRKHFCWPTFSTEEGILIILPSLFAASTFRKMEQYSEEDWCSVDDGSIFLVAS